MRVRYEDSPPNITAALTGEALWANADGQF